MNRQKIFEDTKVILTCFLIGLITFSLSQSLFKAFFVGLFVLWFYLSYEKFFILKNQKENFTEKITIIVGFSVGVLGISALIAWIITDLINGKIILF